MTVILCDGKFPEHKYPLELINNAEKIICCDGAAVKLLNYGKIPYAIVGDLDSLPNDIKERFSDRVYQDSCQETNDQTKAIEWCLKQNIPEVTILGATGLRDDHSIGNISLLTDYIKDIRVKMVTDSGIFYPIISSTTFESYQKQQVSIFAITPYSKITTHGLKYKVSDHCFTSWYQGTLNEALSTTFRIEFDKGKLLVYLSY